MKNKQILISVDVEEFDIPQEYGQAVPFEEKLEVSRQGVLKTLALFDELEVRATFFITALWARYFPELVQRIAEKHEIASHAFYHDRFQEQDLLHSRTELERISRCTVKGFRMPRLQPVNMEALADAGYTYDASLNPTWLPGRYNNRQDPRHVHRQEGMWIMPSSVTPGLRLPVFWLSLKNMPLWFTRYCSGRILAKEDYFSFYFHPWELEDISAYKLPLYVKGVRGKRLYDKMYSFLSWLKERGTFVTHSDYLATRDS
ncbi:polysaccharide deacetylase family protein [Chitinophaga barathri]|uniref:DUF3473 domain-containing protein n=1 Tax=Chitinophaga barathri TaxID=1647451 RepID=A0A3N4MFM2_9BACT|nr:polysaccharide deacetylase family protein [Chitinophaga barathri]RPD42215.1 DUF3473 domain-containing protein [Chitinophaga barathri]